MRIPVHVAVLALVLLGAVRISAAPPAQIDIDVSDAPELTEFGARVKTTAEKWYPLIVAMLPSEGFEAPRHVFISIRKSTGGVAATSGDRISGSARYFMKHQDDVGAFVHELVHVVQHYQGRRPPGWITEGIADYIRWFKYEPPEKRPHPNPDKAKYSDSYRTSAAFLNWTAEKYDKDLVVKLNAVCRAGMYSEGFWKTRTGKSLDELNELWIASLRLAKRDRK